VTSESAIAPLQQWLSANAHPVTDTHPDFTGPDLESLTDRLGSATVVLAGACEVAMVEATSPVHWLPQAN
jgi:hypothetical protein